MSSNQSQQEPNNCTRITMVAVAACFLIGLFVMGTGDATSDHAAYDEAPWMHAVSNEEPSDTANQASPVKELHGEGIVEKSSKDPTPLLEEDSASRFAGSWRNETVGDVYRIKAMDEYRLKFTVQSSDFLLTCSGVLSRVSSDDRYSGRIAAIFKTDRTKQMRTAPLILHFHSSREAEMETDYVMWDEYTGQELRRESVTTFCSR